MGRLALAALLLPVLHLAAGQFSTPSKPSASAVKSDLPYIRCSVCEAVAKQGYRKAKAMGDALPPGKKVVFFVCYFEALLSHLLIHSYVADLACYIWCPAPIAALNMSGSSEIAQGAGRAGDGGEANRSGQR